MFLVPTNEATDVKSIDELIKHIPTIDSRPYQLLLLKPHLTPLQVVLRPHSSCLQLRDVTDQQTHVHTYRPLLHYTVELSQAIIFRLVDQSND